MAKGIPHMGLEHVRPIPGAGQSTAPAAHRLYWAGAWPTNTGVLLGRGKGRINVEHVTKNIHHLTEWL